MLTNRIIQEFNSVSVELAKQRDISVIDLFQLSQASNFKNLTKDGVHYGAPNQPYYLEVARNILSHFFAQANLKYEVDDNWNYDPYHGWILSPTAMLIS